MSYYFYTVPKNIALMLHDKYMLEIFIETGTYAGITAEWASKHFFQVHTIEQSEEYFSLAEKRLLNLPNVTMYLNDSRNILPYITGYVNGRGVLFYLDAHWSEGAHYGRPLIDSVVIDEILLINEWNNNNHAIIVDDAHRFGTERWPTKRAVIEALENNGKRLVRELLDVFIAIPNPLNFTLKRSYIDTYESLNASTVEFVRSGGVWN